MTSGPQHKATVDLAVEAELGRLPTTPIADLRKRYRELFRTEPPKAFGPDLLRRSIAHRIQEKAYGGLPATTRRLLDQLVKAAAASPTAAWNYPGGSSRAPNWCGPGIGGPIGSWCSRSGFAYDGKTFASLSEIATLITGTKWNGPRFFGLQITEVRGWR